MGKTVDEKRAIWLARTSEILGLEPNAALNLLRTPRQQSLRFNPLVADPAQTRQALDLLGWSGTPYPWVQDGYTIDSAAEAVRDSEAVRSGGAFIQNAASWLPVLALNPQAGEKILDVCAAPGGKASHILAITNNEAELVANDNSRPRLAKLQANLARLSAIPTRVTLFDATQLARKLDGEQFDKILLDAPCSGEGLMHYDRDKDLATWSVAHIKRLQKLQKRIIIQAWQLLKPGGTLIYSTCTMAPEENEAIVDYVLRVRPDARLQPLEIDLPNRVASLTAWNSKPYGHDLSGCVRLTPSPKLEAFFVAKLTKS